MESGGPWKMLGQMSAKGVRMMFSAVAGRIGRADVCSRWCYRPWVGRYWWL